MKIPHEGKVCCMDSKIEKTDGGTVLTLYGDVTIQSATELKGILLEQLTGNTDLIVDLSYVTDCDISLFQLLCAARKKSISNKKPIGVSGCSPAIQQVMSSGGFLRESGCIAGDDCSCLWIKREG